MNPPDLRHPLLIPRQISINRSMGNSASGSRVVPTNEDAASIQKKKSPVDEKVGFNNKSSVPDGSGLVKYLKPDVSSFVFDQNTGYRFDPHTGLHYDANSGYFLNHEMEIWLQWDQLSSTYSEVFSLPNGLGGPTFNIFNTEHKNSDQRHRGRLRRRARSNTRRSRSSSSSGARGSSSRGIRLSGIRVCRSRRARRSHSREDRRKDIKRTKRSRSRDARRSCSCEFGPSNTRRSRSSSSREDRRSSSRGIRRSTIRVSSDSISRRATRSRGSDEKRSHSREDSMYIRRSKRSRSRDPRRSRSREVGPCNTREPRTSSREDGTGCSSRRHSSRSKGIVPMSSMHRSRQSQIGSRSPSRTVFIGDINKDKKHRLCKRKQKKLCRKRKKDSQNLYRPSPERLNIDKRKTNRKRSRSYSSTSSSSVSTPDEDSVVDEVIDKFLAVFHDSSTETEGPKTKKKPTVHESISLVESSDSGNEHSVIVAGESVARMNNREGNSRGELTIDNEPMSDSELSDLKNEQSASNKSVEIRKERKSDKKGNRNPDSRKKLPIERGSSLPDDEVPDLRKESTVESESISSRCILLSESSDLEVDPSVVDEPENAPASQTTAVESAVVDMGDVLGHIFANVSQARTNMVLVAPVPLQDCSKNASEALKFQIGNPPDVLEVYVNHESTTGASCHCMMVSFKTQSAATNWYDSQGGTIVMSGENGTKLKAYLHFLEEGNWNCQYCSSFNFFMQSLCSICYRAKDDGFSPVCISTEPTLWVGIAKLEYGFTTTESVTNSLPPLDSFNVKSIQMVTEPKGLPLGLCVFEVSSIPESVGLYSYFCEQGRSSVYVKHNEKPSTTPVDCQTAIDGTDDTSDKEYLSTLFGTASQTNILLVALLPLSSIPDLNFELSFMELCLLEQLGKDNVKYDHITVHVDKTVGAPCSYGLINFHDNLTAANWFALRDDTFKRFSGRTSSVSVHFSEDNWRCLYCNSLNFPLRSLCHFCFQHRRPIKVSPISKSATTTRWIATAELPNWSFTDEAMMTYCMELLEQFNTLKMHVVRDAKCPSLPLACVFEMRELKDSFELQEYFEFTERVSSFVTVNEELVLYIVPGTALGAIDDDVVIVEPPPPECVDLTDVVDDVDDITEAGSQSGAWSTSAGGAAERWTHVPVHDDLTQTIAPVPNDPTHCNQVQLENYLLDWWNRRANSYSDVFRDLFAAVRGRSTQIIFVGPLPPFRSSPDSYQTVIGQNIKESNIELSNVVITVHAGLEVGGPCNFATVRFRWLQDAQMWYERNRASLILPDATSHSLNPSNAPVYKCALYFSQSNGPCKSCSRINFGMRTFCFYCYRSAYDNSSALFLSEAPTKYVAIRWFQRFFSSEKLLYCAHPFLNHYPEGSFRIKFLRENLAIPLGVCLFDVSSLDLSKRLFEEFREILGNNTVIYVSSVKEGLLYEERILPHTRPMNLEEPNIQIERTDVMRIPMQEPMQPTNLIPIQSQEPFMQMQPTNLMPIQCWEPLMQMQSTNLMPIQSQEPEPFMQMQPTNLIPFQSRERLMQIQPTNLMPIQSQEPLLQMQPTNLFPIQTQATSWLESLEKKRKKKPTRKKRNPNPETHHSVETIEVHSSPESHPSVETIEANPNRKPSPQSKPSKQTQNQEPTTIQLKPLKQTPIQKPTPQWKPSKQTQNQEPTTQLEPLKQTPIQKPTPQLKPLKQTSIQKPTPKSKPSNRTQNQEPTTQLKPLKQTPIQKHTTKSKSSKQNPPIEKPTHQSKPSKQSQNQKPTAQSKPLKLTFNQKPTAQSKPSKEPQTQIPPCPSQKCPPDVDAFGAVVCPDYETLVWTSLYDFRLNNPPTDVIMISPCPGSIDLPREARLEITKSYVLSGVFNGFIRYHSKGGVGSPFNYCLVSFLSVDSAKKWFDRCNGTLRFDVPHPGDEESPINFQNCYSLKETSKRSLSIISKLYYSQINWICCCGALNFPLRSVCHKCLKNKDKESDYESVPHATRFVGIKLVKYFDLTRAEIIKMIEDLRRHGYISPRAQIFLDPAVPRDPCGILIFDVKNSEEGMKFYMYLTVLRQEPFLSQFNNKLTEILKNSDGITFANCQVSMEKGRDFVESDNWDSLFKEKTPTNVVAFHHNTKCRKKNFDGTIPFKNYGGMCMLMDHVFQCGFFATHWCLIYFTTSADAKRWYDANNGKFKNIYNPPPTLYFARDLWICRNCQKRNFPARVLCYNCFQSVVKGIPSPLRKGVAGPTRWIGITEPADQERSIRYLTENYFPLTSVRIFTDPNVRQDGTYVLLFEVPSCVAGSRLQKIFTEHEISDSYYFQVDEDSKWEAKINEYLLIVAKTAWKPSLTLQNSEQ